MLLLAALLTIGASVGPAVAHDDLHEQIARCSEKIAAEPNNAALYRRRAELHRLHEDWDRALADLERAGELEPDHPELDHARARVLLDAGWPRSALVIIDRFLALHPKHGPGLWLRARALAALELGGESAAAYDLALRHLQVRTPDHFLERAEAWRARGPDHLDHAIAGLDEGMAELGPIISLQKLAITCELEQRDYAAALKRVDRTLEAAVRKERWLARRGEVLELAGCPAEAMASYQGALAAIESLPARHRNVAATVELQARVEAAIERLGAPER